MSHCFEKGAFLERLFEDWKAFEAFGGLSAPTAKNKRHVAGPEARRHCGTVAAHEAYIKDADIESFAIEQRERTSTRAGATHQVTRRAKLFLDIHLDERFVLEHEDAHRRARISVRHQGRR
jgi:hypothetical protein